MSSEGSEMIRILVPLDGSTLAEQAIGHAIAISKVFSAELLLLRVVTETAGMPRDCIDWQLQRRQATAYLEQVAERLRGAGVRVRATVDEGHPAEVMTRFCRDQNVDLIVLCRFGHGGVTDFGRGSIAQKIIATAPASVLLVGPMPGSDPTDLDVPYKRVLVPVDGTPGSEWAVSMGAMIAQPNDAELLMVHAIERPELPARMPITQDIRDLSQRMHNCIKGEALRRLSELKAQLPANLNATTKVLVTGDVARALHATAEADNADLIVLTAHSSPGEHSWRYGSVCESLLNHTMRPMLVFQQYNAGTASRFRNLYLAEPQADVG
jgi:nucleotide-binding universal stress UspA family protein